MSSEFEIDDAVVLLLGAPSSSPALQGQIKGITRLEKLIFLLENETSLSDVLTEEAGFHAYNFGPFSDKVYKAIDTLSAYRLVEDSASRAQSTEESWESIEAVGADVADPYATRDLQLTDLGREYYERLREIVPDSTLDEVINVKERFGLLPLRQLVRYVYRRYPDMTEKSLIRDDILGG